MVPLTDSQKIKALQEEIDRNLEIVQKAQEEITRLQTQKDTRAIVLYAADCKIDVERATRIWMAMADPVKDGYRRMVLALDEHDTAVALEAVNAMEGNK